MNYMKQFIGKRILSLLMAAAITLAAVPAVFAQGTKNGAGSDSAPHGQVAPLNTDYLDYIENGGNGNMPSTQDFSYLAGSYQRQAMRRTREGRPRFPTRGHTEPAGLSRPWALLSRG